MTPSDDLRTWTLKLRSGISFHDGTPLNAEAIQVNFETQKGDPLVGLAVKPFYYQARMLLPSLTISRSHSISLIRMLGSQPHLRAN